MPSILSFDIGTRHLAYCCLSQPSNQVHIEKWNVVDLMAVKGTPYDDESIWILSKSWKCPQLKSYLEQRGLSSEGKRDVLVKRIHTDLKKRKIPKIASSNLCVLASKIYAYMDNEPWMLDCDIIVLENQPCLTNPVMKSVQILLYGYFLYKGVWQTHKSNTNLQTLSTQGGGGDSPLDNTANTEHAHNEKEKNKENEQTQNKQTQTARPLPRVMLTSATNKLKICRTALQDNEANTTKANKTKSKKNKQKEDKQLIHNEKKKKTSYKERKKEAIELTSSILEQWKTTMDDAPMVHQQRHQQWCELLSSSCMKEKDDLSDSFLQGLYVLYKHT